LSGFFSLPGSQAERFKPLRGDFFLGLSQNLIFIYPVDPVDPV